MKNPYDVDAIRHALAGKYNPIADCSIINHQNMDECQRYSEYLDEAIHTLDSFQHAGNSPCWMK